MPFKNLIEQIEILKERWSAVSFSVHNARLSGINAKKEKWLEQQDCFYGEFTVKCIANLHLHVYTTAPFPFVKAARVCRFH
jgi:hypothetical protein